MTEVAAAGEPALAQNAIIHVIDFADDAIARNDATRKAEAFRLVKVLIKSAAAGTISLDAAKCDHVECLVQTLHLSALAAEVDEEAKGASRLEMQQLRATILRMKASTPSTAAAPAAAARAPAAVAPPASAATALAALVPDVPAWPTSEDTPAPQVAPDNAEDAAMEEAEPVPAPAAAAPEPAAMETEPVIEASGEPF